MINQRKFKEELVTEGNRKNIMANLILNLLKDTDSDFETYKLEDFLSNKNLFRKAKKSVYDMLPDKDQRILDITDRILRGSDREEKQSENIKIYQEAFKSMKTNEKFLSLKKLFNGEENIENIFIRELIISKIEKIDAFKNDNFRENITINYIQRLPLYHKALFIFKILKLFLGRIGFVFLPEKIKGDERDETEDIPSINMNTFSIITGIPFNNDWEKLLTDESADLIARLDGEYTKIFFYHFEINTPDKLNNIAERFVETEFRKKLDKAGIDYKYPTHKNGSYLVEFLHDSFGGTQGLGLYLEIFNINTIEDLEKLFPYGVIHGRMHTWHSTLGLKTAFKLYSFLGIKSVDELVKIFNDKTFLDKCKKYGEVFGDDKYSFGEGNSARKYIDESVELLSLSDKNNIKIIKDTEVSKENWMQLLIGYGACINEEIDLDGDISASYKNLFEELETQNLVYNELYIIYLKIIKQEKINHKELAVLNALGKYGVGNLSYTTLLVNLTNHVRHLGETTGEDVVKRIRNNLVDIEERVSKNWSLMERTNLYGNITSLMITNFNVARTCLSIINILSNNFSKKFSQNILPIIVSWSYLINGEYGYNQEDSKKLDEYISSILQKVKNNKLNIQQQDTLKMNILKSMKKWIQKRFHIKELPLESLVTNIGTIQNYLIYLANIHKKTEHKTAMLGLYLGLQLNNKRSDFRIGKDIKYGEIFDENITRTLRNYFQERKEIDLFTGYSSDQKKTFQNDTSIQTMGTVKTIDTKLSVVKELAKDLLDEDNFGTKDEKYMLQILLKHGKAVGGSLALLFQGKKDLLADNHIQAKQDLQKHFGKLSKENIPYLQMLANKVSPVVNFSNKIEEIGIEEKLEKLNTLKLPNANLVKIFGKTGEKLSTSSGVIPIKNDIKYLEDILHKSLVLGEKEKEIGLAFLLEVKKHLQILEQDFTKVTSIYKNLAKTILEGDNESLKGRIKDMNNVFDNTKHNGEQSFLTTKLTSNFDIIIPNIRGCLQCMKKEINNDTNLTFGDSNKFFAAIFAEDPNKSIADCIVDIFPYSLGKEYNETEARKTFVIERVYGERTPDVLLSIISVILKKKKKSNIDDIDILISQPALDSCGLNRNQIEEFLQDYSFSINEIDNIHVNILKSPSGSGYYEFAQEGWGRFQGIAKTKGILIRKL